MKTRSRYLAIEIPGVENFFDELSAAREAGSLDNAEHRKITLKYGIERLGKGANGIAVVKRKQ